jgi:P4 family phage/plasmid primase-like protien
MIDDRSPREIMLELAASGISGLPIKSDGSKAPAIDAWTGLQERIPTEAEIARLFSNGYGIGLIGGRVSGGLEIIDFDKVAEFPHVFAGFCAELAAREPGLLERLTKVKTPRGWHLYYRCRIVQGNQKLANVMAWNEKEGREKSTAIIETRGEGGYVLAPGCPPDCHETRRTYQHVSGPPLTDISTITPDERDTILIVARCFNEVVDDDSVVDAPRSARATNSLSPGDDFCARATWNEILEPSGWKQVRAHGPISHWRRPGKEGPGTSATTGLTSKAGNELLYVFSSNADPFEAGKSYSKFSAYAALNHAGDFKAAARALGKDGYGDKPKPKHGKSKPTNVGEATSNNLLDPAGRTDLANGRRLVVYRGENLRWCEAWGKWLTWVGTHWTMDTQRLAETFAKDTATAIWRKIAAILPEAEPGIADEMLRFAKQTASARGVGNMLAMAKSEPGMPITLGMLDTDPWSLNVLNGTLDLRTGELRPPNRSDLLTKLCAVEYDPKATCPNWEAMLATIMANHSGLITFLQRAIGYSLTGDVSEQVLFLLWGKGANGKSTLLNAIIDVFGSDYAMQAPDGLLMAKQGEGHPTERADLYGKRIVSSVEIEDGRRLAESLIKQLTGGDPIRARRMREDFWEFWPSHKLWMALNHKPIIRGTDHGIWRRIKFVPFVVTIPDADQDKQLGVKLQAERQGILAWAVRGCLAWQQHGLGEPDEVKAATAEYRGEMDVLGAFISDCCIEGPAFSAKASSIYAAYDKWCQANGEHAVNQRRFGVAISERGIERYKNDGVWYQGVGLITERTE